MANDPKKPEEAEALPAGEHITPSDPAEQGTGGAPVGAEGAAPAADLAQPEEGEVPETQAEAPAADLAQPEEGSETQAETPAADLAQSEEGPEAQAAAPSADLAQPEEGPEAQAETPAAEPVTAEPAAQSPETAQPDAMETELSEPQIAEEESAAASAAAVDGEAASEPALPAQKPERRRATFASRMADAGYLTGRRYDAVKNMFLSYIPASRKVRPLRARISGTGETFTVGRNQVARVCVVGGYLRLFLALDPKAYNVQKYHHKDYTEVVRYAKTPFMIKLSSDRQERYALELIDEVLRANGLEPDPNYIPRDQADVFAAARTSRRSGTRVVYVPAPADGAEAASEAAAAETARPDEEAQAEGSGQGVTDASLAAASAVAAAGDSVLDSSAGAVLDLEDEDTYVGEPEAIDVCLPRCAAVVDKKGRRIGKIRNCTWYDGENNVCGVLRKEETNVFVYDNETRTAYVDKNDNILTTENKYLATIRRFLWLPVLIAFIMFAAITVVTVLLSMYFLSRSENYIPTIFIAHAEEGRVEWSDEENIPVFMNETFGDTVIAPGVSGSYRFMMRNENDDPLIFSLTFAEENPFGIGLGYRLKRDGAYIAGHADYTDVESVSVHEMTIEEHSSTIFELEWYWQHNDEVDTAAGENEATYTLHISFLAMLDDRS